jgi:phosphatidylglycerophosphatase A
VNGAKRWLATMGGVGNLPASGTFASLLTCLILWPIFAWVGPSAPAQNAIAVVGVLFFCGISIPIGAWAIANFGDKDPGRFVLDEAAGICLTLVLLPAAGGQGLGIKMLAAFLMFRVFDITKPPPVRQFEKLPGAWGVLVDDLAAAVYANIACQLILRWLIA